MLTSFIDDVRDFEYRKCVPFFGWRGRSGIRLYQIKRLVKIVLTGEGRGHLSSNLRLFIFLLSRSLKG